MQVFKSPLLNGWRLFSVVAGFLSASVVIKSLNADLSTGAGVSEMIGFSVRLAVPFVYLAMAASAMRYLFPGAVTNWWLRNRRYIGLCFAVAMAWQGMFIFIISTVHRGYYVEEVYLFRDELEGSLGYIFLSFMVLTSFSLTRRYLSQQQWSLLHTSGTYFLWAYPFTVYWWSLSYYQNPTLMDYCYYWAGFLAFAVRIAAWGKKRFSNTLPLSQILLGAVLIAAGLVWSAAGLYFQSEVTDFLLAPGWSATLLLWLPYWPFEPFLSLALIGLGTAIMTIQPQPVIAEEGYL